MRRRAQYLGAGPSGALRRQGEHSMESKRKRLGDPSWKAGYRAGTVLAALYVIPPNVQDRELFRDGYIVGRRLATQVRDQRPGNLVGQPRIVRRCCHD